MLPVAIAFMALGSLMGGAAKAKSDRDQADAERKNADFYREQAANAKFTGDRELLLFDRSSKITYGEQASAFAKAGVDTAESSRFLAQQQLFGSQQTNALTKERDMNVRLATLKAEQADTEAFQLDSAAGWDMFSGIVGAGSSVAQGASGSGYGSNPGTGDGNMQKK
jgi:hypothetical protein